MTYKLEPWVRKITSMVTVVLPDGLSRRYISGGAAAKDTFPSHYVVDRIAAVGSEIVLTLKEVEMTGSTWVGEEQTFF